MGRVPMGSTPLHAHVSQNIRRVGLCKTKLVKQLQLAPSRRRPFGWYDVLGVPLNATREKIGKAFRALSVTCHPDKHVGKTPHEQSCLTKRFQLLNNAHQVLSDDKTRREYDECHSFRTSDGPPSTVRVRIHRQGLSEKQRLIVSSIEQARQRRARDPKAPYRQKMLPRVGSKVDCKLTKGKVHCLRAANCNNKLVDRAWVVVKRTKSEMKKDGRRNRFVVLTPQDS